MKIQPLSSNQEAAVAAIFVAACALPVLVLFSYIVIGPQASGNHLSILVVLVLAATASAFVSARSLLARSRLNTYAAGLKLGLWSAVGFYLFWLLLFGVIPSLVASSDGDVLEAVRFFFGTFWYVLGASYGIPVVVGLAAGVFYVGLKRKFLRHDPPGPH